MNLELTGPTPPRRRTFRRVSDTPCSFPDCENNAERGGHCWAHVWQEQNGKRLTAVAKRPTSALERLTEAAIAYAEADGDDEFNRAKDNLRKSAAAYARREPSRAGRPRKVEPAEVFVLVEQLGGTRKAAFDALKGVAWNDDSQVVEIYATRHDDKANPRLEIEVEQFIAADVAAVGVTR